MATKNKALCDAINEKFESEAACARALDWPRQRLNKITTYIKVPDVNEVNAIAFVLEIPVGEVCSFFLSEKSPNGQQAG